MTEPLRPEQLYQAVGPGDEEAGVIKPVKEAMMFALRESITGAQMEKIGDSKVSVTMEYPRSLEEYPNIWVNFSFTKFERAGVGHEATIYVSPDRAWPIREFIFEGRVTLTVMALKNAERDRLSDKILTTVAFSRPPSPVLLDPDKNTNQHRQFWTSLAKNPFVFIAANTDKIIPGGQGTSYGTAVAAPEQLIYEDSYSFDIRGEFTMVYRNDGNFILRRIDQLPAAVADGNYDQNGYLTNPNYVPDDDEGWV